MFRRGGVHTKSASAPPPTTHNSGGSSSAKGGEELALSPAELRAGLGSLGVPLSDADLISLVAKTCPGRRGKVTYPDFCDVLGLQRISADSEAYTNFSLESRDLLSGHKIGRGKSSSDVPKVAQGDARAVWGYVCDSEMCPLSLLRRGRGGDRRPGRETAPVAVVKETCHNRYYSPALSM